MPKKPVKNVKRKTKKHVFKKKAHNMSASTNLIKFMPKASNQVLPSRYMTKFTAVSYGFMSPGANSGDLRFNFEMNTPLLPFQNTVFVNGGTWTYNNITMATYQPPGFSTLLNANTYRSYRCLASSIEVEVDVQSVADSVTVAVTPSNSTAVPATVGAALSQRYTKSKTVISGNNRSVKHFMPIYKFEGVRKQAIEDDLSGNFTSAYNAVPGKLYYWIVNVETGDNAVLNSALIIRFKIVYYTECFDQTNSTLPIV